MMVVPLHSVPSQTVYVTLNGQPCQIDVYQKSTGMFVNLWVNGALTIGGVIAENQNVIVRDAYLGFSGDLAFFDTMPAQVPGGAAVPSDPYYTGLGTRFFLGYSLPSELPAGVQ